MGVLDVARRKTPMRLSYLGTVPSISLMLASPVLAQTDDAGTAMKPFWEQDHNGWPQPCSLDHRTAIALKAADTKSLMQTLIPTPFSL
jgi:hypothetical protein